MSGYVSDIGYHRELWHNYGRGQHSKSENLSPRKKSIGTYKPTGKNYWVDLHQDEFGYARPYPSNVTDINEIEDFDFI